MFFRIFKILCQSITCQRSFTRFSKYLLLTVILIVLFHLFFAHLNTQHHIQNTDKSYTLNEKLPAINHDPYENKPLFMEKVQIEKRKDENITVAITICGNQSLIQGMNALKSVLILSSKSVHFVIMADEIVTKFIVQGLGDMRNLFKTNFTYEINLIQFPLTNQTKVWRKLFKECASQRLFLPSILKNFDSILYIDTDVLFLSPVEELWSHFYRMNSSQMAAMTSESEDFSSNWYHKFAKHPYYGNYGLNSGVMLMNLTRMRQFGWIHQLEPVLFKYRDKIVWGDQDIINIIFHSSPDKLYLLECNWNYRPDHCIYSSICKNAEKDGIKIFHGNRGVFLNEKCPEFKSVFNVFQDYSDPELKRHELAKFIQISLKRSRNHSNCFKVSRLFWMAIDK